MATDIYRNKIESGKLSYEIVLQIQNFQCKNIIIESTTSTELLLQSLAAREIYPIKYSPKDSKEIRANYASELLEYGKIYLKRNASWLDDFKAEIIAFPYGKHDDQVDAFSQLILGSTNHYDCQLEMLNKMVDYSKSEERQARIYATSKQLGFRKLF